MTKNRDLKKRVRARMAKTGESYTAARAHLVGDLRASVEEYADLAGMSDEAVSAKTGKTWRAWVDALDALDATSKTHREIAAAVRERWPAIGGWWAQSVTVGYERIRKLRARGQQRTTKLFDANKSRTFAVPVDALYRAFHDGRRRARWLGVEGVERASATEGRRVRLEWPDGTTALVSFTDKGPSKSSVAIQHRKLSSKADADRAKEAWADRLDALAAQL